MRRAAAVVLFVMLGISGCGRRDRPETIWSAQRPDAPKPSYSNDDRSGQTEMALYALDRVEQQQRASRSRVRTVRPPPAVRARVCSLEYIKEHESGGDYGAVSRSGKYAGAYQWDRRTWAGSVIRSGHPEYANGPANEAPPDVQDAAAAQLYSERGSAPWSVCR